MPRQAARGEINDVTGMRAVAVHEAARQRQEPRMMTAAPTESLSTEGVRTLEVRWIFPGELASAVAGWFARFPVKTTVVDDAYLLDPHLPGLSVKVRGEQALEVKVYRGSPGFLEVAGRARGRLEELTDVHARGEAWWTLGFEATGPASVLRSELEAAAAIVFAVALPGGLELGVDDSRSYTQWLCQRPQAAA